MEIVLYSYSDLPNKINKNLSDGTTLTGALRQPSSVTNPTITVNVISDLTGYNYAYISEFDRYYFINDIVYERTDIAVIHMTVDVLMSFADQLNHSTVIVEKSADVPNVGTPYIKTENDVVLVKRKTDIVQFSNGFNDDGEFILITAGGFAS